VTTEWELLQVISNVISLLWGRSHLDLFATVTMLADAGSLDLDAVFFLSDETVDSL
jgi:hypothetical protein